MSPSSSPARISSDGLPEKLRVVGSESDFADPDIEFVPQRNPIHRFTYLLATILLHLQGYFDSRDWYMSCREMGHLLRLVARFVVS
jgi:hypothetical protein